MGDGSIHKPVLFFRASCSKSAKTLEYLCENWFGVFVQDNCKITEQDSDQVLKKAWKYLEDYFDWEEEQEEE
jgi:hypothetical protein